MSPGGRTENVSPHTATVIPSGTLTVGHKDTLKVTGTYQDVRGHAGKARGLAGVVSGLDGEGIL